MHDMFKVRLLFEVNDEGMTCEIEGHTAGIMAGLTSLIDQCSEELGMEVPQLLEHLKRGHESSTKIMAGLKGEEHNCETCTEDCPNAGKSIDPEGDDFIEGLVTSLLADISLSKDIDLGDTNE